MNIIEQLENFGICPVVCPPEADMSEHLSDLLAKNGMPLIEITLRLPHGLEVIRRMHQRHPEMLIGAGTVLTTSQIDDAISAGASFIVSPGLDDDLVKYCRQKNITIFPGIATPSEIMQAIKLGLTHLKFFPADVLGGLKTLAALHAPFTQVKFMPTGGISQETASDYLKCDYVFALGGGFVAPAKLMKANDWDGVENAIKNAVAIVKNNL